MADLLSLLSQKADELDAEVKDCEEYSDTTSSTSESDLSDCDDVGGNDSAQHDTLESPAQFDGVVGGAGPCDPCALSSTPPTSPRSPAFSPRQRSMTVDLSQLATRSISDSDTISGSTYDDFLSSECDVDDLELAQDAYSPRLGFGSLAVAPCGAESSAWYYLDSEERAQGPFDQATMERWKEAGYLPDTLMVRLASEERYSPFSHRPEFSPPNNDECACDGKDDGAEQRVAHVRHSEVGEERGIIYGHTKDGMRVVSQAPTHMLLELLVDGTREEHESVGEEHERVAQGHVTWETFMRTLLATHPMYLPSVELLQHLLSHDISSEDLFSRVVRVLTCWLEEFPSLFSDVDLIHPLEAWLANIRAHQKEHNVSLNGARVDGLASLFAQRKEAIMALGPFEASLAKADDVLCGEQMSVPDVRETMGRALARQLTLIDWELFQEVKLGELVSMRWSGEDACVSCPGVARVVARFNEVSAWMMHQICEKKDLRGRLAVIEALLRVAQEFQSLNNVFGMMAISTAFSSAPVQRLKRTFRALQPSAKTTLEELQALLAPESNFKRVREVVRETLVRGDSIVPFLGITLSDLTMLGENNTTISGTINFDKCRLVYNVLRQVQQAQKAPPYDITPVSHLQRDYAVRERLYPNAQSLTPLSAKEIYDLSLEAEPRRRARKSSGNLKDGKKSLRGPQKMHSSSNDASQGSRRRRHGISRKKKSRPRASTIIPPS